MDWAGVLASESTKEEKMSTLTVGFAVRMRKRDAEFEDEPSPIPDGKRPKLSSPGEEAEKAIILMDSPDRAANDQPVLEGAPSEGSAPQEEGILSRGPVLTKLVRGPF